MPLGDFIASALKLVGITPERVSAWLGEECGCEERRAKLNQLDVAARMIVKGRLSQARLYLETLFCEEH